MSEKYTAAEVGKHKSADDGFWLIVESDVYDVTRDTMRRDEPDGMASPLQHHTDRGAEFMDEHPGGAKIIKRWSGKDATKPFWKYHNEDVLKKYGASLKIGSVPEKAKL
ncbi:hypothetical protein G7Z17_g5322 [Cylindrodendrum hubeiense]|uniref:Cytochrome b5 heme-binding domain-containing protein n=1 Tax=Cylindrodendrum hubeiense TaxID=595255 RepID=A0A9P5LBT9_9HYPO|nr:hypothetical protein G7Z17_g5322 [Cylindrodendrum hubeiense]